MPEIEDVLKFVYSRWDLDECSIRHYLVELAKRCWVKEEGFGGKRPFGNSGWKWDVYYALADGGFVTGTKDDEGNWVDIDCKKAESIILACFDKIQSA